MEMDLEVEEVAMADLELLIGALHILYIVLIVHYFKKVFQVQRRI